MSLQYFGHQDKWISQVSKSMEIAPINWSIEWLYRCQKRHNTYFVELELTRTVKLWPKSTWLKKYPKHGKKKKKKLGYWWYSEWIVGFEIALFIFCLGVKVLAFKVLCIYVTVKRLLKSSLLVTNGIKLQIIMGLDKTWKEEKPGLLDFPV